MIYRGYLFVCVFLPPTITVLPGVLADWTFIFDLCDTTRKERGEVKRGGEVT